MVKKICTYILIAVLLANLMAYQCVYVCFRIQQKQIAATLCVQKEVKGNACQGKCHLKKMVKKAEASTQKVQSELKNDFICQDLPLFELSFSKVLYDVKLKPYSQPKLADGCVRINYSPPDLNPLV